MANVDDGLTGIVPSPASHHSSASSSGLEDDDEEEDDEKKEKKDQQEGAEGDAQVRPAASSMESGLSASSSESEDKPEGDEDVVRSLAALKDELRPELAGELLSQSPGSKAAKKEAMRVADSVAQVVHSARRSSVTKGKPAPSLRAFNEARRNSHAGAHNKHGHGHGHRRNSRVVLIEDEGGAAEKIERQRRMSVRPPTVTDEPKGRTSVHTGSTPGKSPTSSAQLGLGSQVLSGLRRTSVAPRLSAASSDVSERNRWQQFKSSIVPTCRTINRSRAFLAIMFVALLLALFLPDIWVLTDRQTNVDLDALLTVILLAFCFEFVVQCIATYNIYIGSFFFYMDILGAMSLLLDMTYVGIQALIQSAGGVGNQVVIMRAARIAKLGARVGRFTKLVKLLRFLPGLSGRSGDQGSAKVINSRLTHSLSTRVSCLIILLVLIIPLFSMWSFPQTDMSMTSWSDRLDDISLSRPDVLERELGRIDTFYATMDYYPYQILAKPGVTLPNSSLALLPWSSSRPAPVRSDGTQTQESNYLTMYFNWTSVNQTDSAMNLMLLVFVMILMVSFSMVLQRTTRKMVLQPVEKLLNQVKDTAAQVFESVPDLGGGPGEDEDNESATEENEDGTWKEANFNPEIHLLDKVVQKVTDLQKKEDKADGGTSQWTGGRQSEKDDSSMTEKKTKKRVVGSLFVAEDEGSGPTDAMSVVTAERELLEASGLTVEALSDWRVNPMEFDKVMNRALAAFIIGPANHGIRCEQHIRAFVDEIEGDAKSNPYHNWFHAVDVGHATWRLANICQVTEYLAFHETFAMLVAALCHDLAHPGLNNRFLVETRHPLAMTYNDRSCLESMSCSRLFEIVSQPHCAIFEPLSRSMYHTVRKVTIAAILNTDTAQHFQAVKKVQMFYEMNSEVLSPAADLYREQVEEDEEEPIFPIPEVTDVFKDSNNKQTLINLMVHLADTSNSAKPFRICKIWAQKAMEENFLQGDHEKALGLPIQAMNDRFKANLPLAQFGFIEYLVAPFLMTVIKVLPPVEPLLAQMMLNAKCWQGLYEEEALASTEEKEALQSRVTDLIRLYNESRKQS